MSTALIWIRRDLRLQDHFALWEASLHHSSLVIVYIREIDHHNIGGASKWWLHHSLTAFQKSLERFGQKLILRTGSAAEVLLELLKETKAKHIYWNQGDEPVVIKQEEVLQQALFAKNITVKTFAPSLLFPPWLVKSKSQSFYKIFSPFWKACLRLPEPAFPLPIPIDLPPTPFPLKSESLASWELLPKHPNWAKGLQKTWIPGEIGAQTRLETFLKEHLVGYHHLRNRPDLPHTSFLSPYLHFGEISPRQIWHAVQSSSAPSVDKTTFLQEIGWREFSAHLLYHLPSLPEQNLRPVFNHFPWEVDRQTLLAWQKGQTGYPLVDAGMRQLWEIGWMHNRVRMLVASFLVKDLRIDWRQGEAWFWDTLVDADLANNAANWQWVAGSGTDAAPYFRIFHPVLQGEKFDPNGDYIRRYVPELAKLPSKWIHKPWLAPAKILQQAGVILGETYPKPVVDHHIAREQALEIYRSLIKPQKPHSAL